MVYGTWYRHIRCHPSLDDTFRYHAHAPFVRFIVVVYRKIKPISSIELEVNITWAANGTKVNDRGNTFGR